MNFFLLIYFIIIEILLLGRMLGKMVWLETSQHTVNRHSYPCSMMSICLILNGACLIFAVTGNVLENCCFPPKMFLNVLEFSF